jgi:4-amino-4-deoxy-L-arabinose transferase-like glycosyltransferase
MTSLLTSLRPHILFIGLLVFYFIVRCFYMDAVPRWDAASYWDALRVATESTKAAQNWDDFHTTLMRDYNAFGHTSMGYYGILVLGQLIDFPNLFILNLTNILLACLSIFCVYKILLWFFPDNRNKTEVLLATAAYAFNPLFFGCSIFLNTDFPVQVFFTAALASLLYGRYFLFSIASFFMIFSKETGALFYMAMGLGIGLPALY